MRKVFVVFIFTVLLFVMFSSCSKLAEMIENAEKDLATNYRGAADARFQRFFSQDEYGFPKYS